MVDVCFWFGIKVYNLGAGAATEEIEDGASISVGIAHHITFYFQEDIRIQHNLIELNNSSLSVAPSHTDTPISRCTLWHVGNFSNLQNEGVKLCRTQDGRFL